jgi:hypothetical protein
MKKNYRSFLFLLIWGYLSFCSSYVTADQPPALAMKDSIPVAENSLAKANIDLARYYLYQIEYSSSSEGYYWFLTYQAINTQQDNEIFVKVYMDKSTDISGVGNIKRKKY